MRLRMLLAFVIVIIIAILAVFFFAQQATTEEVRAFLGRGGWMGAEEFVPQLTAYYEENGSWNGVESLFSQGGHGRQGNGNAGRNQPAGTGPYNNLSLIDKTGLVIYSTVLTSDRLFTSAELENGIELVINDQVEGYLISNTGSASPNPNFEATLLAIIQQASIKAALISVAIALPFALIMATLLLRPVNSLTKAASRLSEGKLDTRVDVKSPVELVTLGDAFNHMAQSLEDAEFSRKAMTADIAHELRTPLAVQRANLEALQDGVFPLNEESIEPILAQNLLLTRLVEDLRTLALVDAGELRLEKRQVDIGYLVEETVERFRAKALEKQIDLSWSKEGMIPEIVVDPERIQQVLYNLLQNSLRYTPDGGWVKVITRFTHHEIIISVRDSGHGIEPEALLHIFDRFYRADKARDRERGGTGLGLTIAKQLMVAHGGDLKADNHSEGGAEFSVILPV